MSTKSRVTVAKAAKALKVSPQRVRALCRAKKVRSEKVGSTWFIHSDSLYEYEQNTASRVAEDQPNYTVKSKKPIVLSFFSGAMGLDLGLERAGFSIRLACEMDKYCRQTISINRPNVALIGDITQHDADSVLKFAGLTRQDDVDLIVGGPPCQAFSTAGKRKGFADTRGNAFLSYLTLALDIRPRYLVIENVRGLLSCPMNHRPHNMRGEGFPDLALDETSGGALNFVVNLIEKSGYACSFNLYNAANFGTPQNRERLVIVCSRDGQKPPFLEPTHSQEGGNGLEKWNTFRQAVKGILKHHHINFPEKRLVYYRLLKEGQNWKDLPDALQQKALGRSYFSGGGKTGFLRRLAWDKPAPTLVTHPAMPATDLAHPKEERPLSVEEYKRIQEFPDDWKFAGPLLEQYKQIGNAVPGGLGYAIGKLVMKLLQGKRVNNPDDFAYSRYKLTKDTEWRENFRRLLPREEGIEKRPRYGT